MADVIHRRHFIGQTAIGAAAMTASTTLGLAKDESSEVRAPIKTKVGLITHEGGAHLAAYFLALAKAEEVGSVVLADPDGNAEREARKALGDKLTRVYKSRDELLASEKPTMALISVEGREGPAAIYGALKAGCHVLAEKPACVNAEDFGKLVVEADRRNLCLMLVLANRLNPEILEARRLIAGGHIGKVYGLELHMIQDQTRLTAPEYQKSWLADKGRAGGGHLIWLGLHWVDVAVFLTDAKVHQVAGFIGNVGGQSISVEDSAAMTMSFDNGTFGTLTSGYYLDKGYQSHIKIWGAKGWISIESDLPGSLHWYSTESGNSPAVQEFVGPRDFDAYPAFVRAAVRASVGLQKPPITSHESLHALNAVFAMYRAAEIGRTQSL